MMPLTSQKEVLQFVVLLYFYRDVSERCSHNLYYLTKIKSIKMKYKWTKIEQESFEEIKQILAHILLEYPYFNIEFKIYTNSSDLQL